MKTLQGLSLVLAGAVFAAACGDSKSSMNPTAPSAVVVDGSQNDESGGVSSATGKNDKGKDKEKEKEKAKNGNGNGNGNNQPTVPTTPTGSGNVTPPSNTTPPAPVTRKVELEGMISAKGTNTITVNAQLVSVPSSAVIRHGSKTFKFSDLKVGNRVHVKGTREQSAAATATTIVASEVKLQNAGETDDDDDGEDPAASMLVSVMALDPAASETGADPGTFRLTRSGDLTAPLVVTFTLTGTATNGVDYQAVPLTVTIPAGQATVSVSIVPLADTTAEGSETVILTVVDGAGYTAGSPAAATVAIAG